MKQKFATTKTVLISLLLVLAICCLAVTVALTYSEQVAKAEGQVVAAGQPVTSVDELPQDSSSGNGTMPIANAGTASNFTQFKNYWDDATYDKITLSGTVTLTSNITLTRSLTIELNNNNLVVGDYTITVNSGGSLIVQDTATNKTSRSVQAFKTVDDESRSAVPITGGVVVGGDANAFRINAGGEMELKSGTIAGVNKNNGAVFVSNGSFTMSNGAISYNHAGGGAGGVYLNGGSFTLKGGTISYNYTTTSGGAVYANYNGSFIMENGTITGNKAGGWGGGVVLNNGSSFTMKNGTISGNTANNGGGVALIHTESSVTTTEDFTMSGGTISGNTATNGGGVCVNYGTFTMNNTDAAAVINGSNKAERGGGVYVNNGTFIMNAGTISGNTATTGNGVYLNSANSKIVLGGTASCDVMLGANVTLDAKSTIAGTVTIDLNNYNLSVGTNTITINDGGSLTIQDTAGEKTERDVQAFKVGESGRSNIPITGGVVVGGDANAVRVNSGGKLLLKSGTIAGVNASNGAVFVNGGSFTMSGGAISYNHADGGAGGVYLNGTGSFVMEDGTISYNYTTTSGGGVYANGESSFTMNKGSILGNKADAYGGGVTVNNNATFIMNNGTISNNTAKNGGGVGLFVGSSGYSGPTFTMNNGTISGNTAISNGGGVFLNNNAVFTMSGASTRINGSNTAVLGGGVYVGTGTFTISNSIISDNKATTNGNGVYVNSSDSKINIIGTASCDVMLGAAVTLDTALEISGTVTIDLNNHNLILGDNTITINNGGVLTIQDTAEKKTAREVQAFKDPGDDFRSAVSINGGVIVGGDANAFRINAGGEFELKGGTIAGVDKNNGAVWVYGGTFTMSGGAISYNHAAGGAGGVYLNAGSFIMKDGTISYNYTATSGGGVYVNYTGSFTMENGTITGNKAGGWGGGVVINNGASFTMKDGTISDNTANNGGGVALIRTGDGTSIENFTMSGGTISGNTANNGGGVCVSIGSFTMSGGTISENTAKGTGAGVYIYNVNSKIVLSGTATCDITLGSDITLDAASTIGGTVTIDLNNYNLFVGMYTITVSNGGSLTIQDTAAKKTSREVQAFNVGETTRSAITITGGVVVGGDANAIKVNSGGILFLKSGTIAGVNANNGAVWVNSGSFTMTGGAVSYNNAAGGAGGVYISGRTGSFTMEGGTISYNHTATSGGGVYANSEASFTMTGGTIEYNKADSLGGGVMINNGATFTMSGDATISHNTAGNHGGGVAIHVTSTDVYSDSKFTMLGGTISGNTATNHGGGVWVSGNGTFIMSGATAKISDDNTATNGGGVYVNSGTTFTMSAGTISGNTVTGNGGGVFVAKGGAFNLSDAPVIKGNKKGNANNNVYLASGANINITAAITSEANSIGITAETDGVFTTGINVTATTGFFADDSGKCLGVTEEYKLSIATHSVTNWKYTSEQHWQECTNCGVKDNEGAHGWSWSAEGETHNATCSADCGVEQKTHSATNPNEWTESTAEGHSGICAAEGCTIKITRDHTYTGTWDQEEEYHSQTCTAPGCEYKKTEGHNLDGYVDAGDGANHMAACTICQKTGVKSAHTPNTSVKPQGDQFSHWYECTLCSGDVKTNHDWTSLPYATDNSGQHWQFCEDCEFKYNETGHTKSEILQKDATCGDSGTRGYFTCLVCKFNFEDDSLTIEIKDIEDWLTKGEGFIPADESAHVWSAWLYDTANDEHYKQCSVCRKESGRAVHNLQLMEGTPASCTENGTHEYYYCRVCRSAFEDKNGSKVIGDQDTLDDWLENGAGKIEAGHSWNEKGICTVCGDYSKWLEDMRGLVEELEDPEKSELEKKLDEVDPSKPGYVPPEDPEQTLGDIEQEIKGALEEQNPGLAEEKEQSIEQLNEEASKKNKEIADDSNLSDEQKKELQEQVNKELEKAKRNVELATDSDGVEQALEQGKEAINGIEADDVKPEDGHTHKWSDDWSFDEHGHWHACESCDEHKDYAPHALTRESSNITSNGSESHSGECVCGTTVTEKHVADGSSYQDNHDLSGHWHVCTICEAHIDVVSHDWNGSWTATKDNHYQECKECGQRYEQDHDLIDMPQQDAQCEFFGDGVPGVRAYSVCETCGMYFDEEGNEIGNRQAFENWTKNKGKIDPEHSFDKNGVCTKCGDYSKALEDMRKKLEQLPEGPEKEELEDELNKLDPNDPSYEEDDVPDDIDSALEDLNGKINDAINDNNDGLKEAKDAAKEEIQNKAEEERNKVDKDDTLSDEAKAAKKAEIDKEEQKILDEIDNATSSGEVDEKKEAGLESLGKAADRYVPDESHTHSWSDTPSSDATGHWYACEECGERKGYEKHVLTSSSENLKANGNETHTGECTVCGRSVTQSHVSDGTTYQQNHDRSGHWLVCAVCNAQFKKVEHEWSEDWQVADSYHYQECEVCNEVYKQDHSMSNWTTTGSTEHTRSCEICSKEETKTHAWGETYYDDGKGNHYQVCADCGYETEHSQHSVSSWTNKNSEIHQGQCSECQLTVTEEHDWETETRSSDDNGHWFKCKSTDCTARNDYQIHSVTSWEKADSTNHKGQCECGKEITQAHILGELKKEAEGNKYYQECTVDGCDYETEHKDLGDVHVHSWEWKNDEFSHWQECTDPDCAARKDEKAHTFGEWSVEGGKHEHTCSEQNCGYTVTESHKLVAHKGIEASCTQFGQQPYWFCSTCEKNFKDADGKQLIEMEIEEWLETVGEGKIDKTSHSYDGDWMSNAEGHWKVCSVCGNKQSAPANHVYGSWTDAKNGQHFKECETCNFRTYEAHSYSANWQGADGYHFQKCDNCDHVEQQTHNNGLASNRTAQVNPTEDTPGVKAYSKCSICNTYFDDNGNKIGDEQELISWKSGLGRIEPSTSDTHEHSFIKKNQHDGVSHWDECECGARQNVTAHQVSEWTMKDATTHTGECTVCGATVTQAHKLNKNNECDDCEYVLTNTPDCNHVVTSGTSNGNETHSGVCEICGLTVSVAHVWSEEYVTDEHGHWYECTVCGDRKDYAEHHVAEWTSDGEHTHTGTCEVCGEVITHEHSWLFGFCTECPDQLKNYSEADIGIAATAIVAQLFALIAVAAIVSRRMKR